MAHEHSCCEVPEKIALGRNLKIVGSIFIAVFGVSFLHYLAPVSLSFLKPLNVSIISYFSLIWWAILLGLIVGGLIDYFIPDGFIFKYLGRKKKTTLFYAVVAGFLLSACSHGILAIAMQLYKKGAGIPAVITFLMASPWANLPVTILLFGFFGWKAFFFIGAAMVIALITGFIYMILENSGLIEKSKKVVAKQSYRWDNVRNFNFKHSLRGVTYGTVNLANMVLWWILIGFLAAAVIRAYIPEDWFTTYLGANFTGLLLTLAFATIIEVCSEGSAPIAFEIFNKVGALGNPFIFLMAGVATDYTEIGLIWTNIGRRTALWLPVVAVPQIVFVAWLFNMFL